MNSDEFINALKEVKPSSAVPASVIEDWKKYNLYSQRHDNTTVTLEEYIELQAALEEALKTLKGNVQASAVPEPEVEVRVEKSEAPPEAVRTPRHKYDEIEEERLETRRVRRDGLSIEEAYKLAFPDPDPLPNTIAKPDYPTAESDPSYPLFFRER